MSWDELYIPMCPALSAIVSKTVISLFSSNLWQPRFCFVAGNRWQSLGDKFASFIDRTICSLWNNFTILNFLYNVEFYLQNILQFNDNVHVNTYTSNFTHFYNFGMINTICCEYTIKTYDDGQLFFPKHVALFNKIKLRNSAICWLLLYACITMHGPLNVKFPSYSHNHFNFFTNEISCHWN